MKSPGIRSCLLSYSSVAAVLALGCSQGFADREVIEGLWGGVDIRVEAGSGKTYVQLSCADGEINGKITLDDDGSYIVTGTIAIGPVVRESVVARYSGQLVGDTLTVAIALIESDTSFGPFRAIRGVDAHLIQCR